MCTSGCMYIRLCCDVQYTQSLQIDPIPAPLFDQSGSPSAAPLEDADQQNGESPSGEVSEVTALASPSSGIDHTAIASDQANSVTVPSHSNLLGHTLPNRRAEGQRRRRAREAAARAVALRSLSSTSVAPPGEGSQPHASRGSSARQSYHEPQSRHYLGRMDVLCSRCNATPSYKQSL